MKYQFAVAATVYSGSSICAFGWVMPAIRASVPLIKKFAANPPATPANAFAIPNRGDRPAAK